MYILILSKLGQILGQAPGPLGPPRGPLGSQGAPGAPSPLRWVRRKKGKTPQKIALFEKMVPEGPLGAPLGPLGARGARWGPVGADDDPTPFGGSACSETKWT